MEEINDTIKVRLTEIIAWMRNHVSVTDTLRELALSKSDHAGRSEYFRQRIHGLKQEMTKQGIIADNWVMNGCLSITDPMWLEEVIMKELKVRPESDVWQEVQGFLKQYFRIENYGNYAKERAATTIIKKEYITAIYNKFRERIKEPLEAWTERFVYPSTIEVTPMELDSRAVEGSDRLVILAILSQVYKLPHPDFVYENFVSDRFGIKNFHKTISSHKNKRGFKATATECNAIFKIMTPFQG